VRALVTGAGGFIGSHLTSALISAEWDVVGMTRSSGSALPGNRSIVGDVTDGALLGKVLAADRFDVVFHLAGRDAFTDPVELFRTNVLGTAVLLEAIRGLDQPKLKVVLLGSSAQYGLAGKDPVDEKTAFQPVSNYGVSKMTCEAMGRLCYEQTGQHVTVARPFNVIGPGQSRRLLQGSVVEQIVEIERGKRPAVVEVGDLSAYRDFVDVRDAAAALMAIAEHGEAGEAYNVCSGRAVQAREAVALLMASARIPIELLTREHHGAVNLAYQRGCNSKLAERANWVPTIPLGQSLDDALDERRSRDGIEAGLTVEERLR